MNLKAKPQLLEAQQGQEFEIPAQRSISISESWRKATKAKRRKLIRSIIKRAVSTTGRILKYNKERGERKEEGIKRPYAIRKPGLIICTLSEPLLLPG